MKRVLAAIVLAASLLAAVAVPASAHASVGPRVPDCSVWSTVASGSPTSVAGGTITVSLQRLTPGWCPDLRDKVVVSNLAAYTLYIYVDRWNGSYYAATLIDSGGFGNPGTYYSSSWSGASFPGSFKAEVDANDWDNTWYGVAYSSVAYLS